MYPLNLNIMIYITSPALLVLSMHVSSEELKTLHRKFMVEFD